MPLRKLWNSIRGVSAQAPDRTAADASAAKPADSGPDHPKLHPERAETAARPARVKRAAISRDDKKVCKQIQALSARSVLEVCIGDGKRALSIVSSLTHKGHSTPVNYIAIDAFEMGGGELSLRDFHKQLREYPAKAHLVPMSIDAGLDRVVSTFGQVDVIVWGNDAPPTPAQENKLSRLSKPNTVVLVKQDHRWVETPVLKAPTATPSRRAA